MLITAVITKDELTELVSSLTPLRINIDERRGRALKVSRPQLELVPGRGLRLAGDARVTWDVVGVPIQITIQTWAVMFCPRIVVRGRSHLLVFDPVLEALDLKRVPSFLDDAIVNAIMAGLAQSRDRLAWDFTRALSKRVMLPPRIEPIKALEIGTSLGSAEVTADELRLTVELAFRADKRVTRPATTRTAPAAPTP